MSDSQTGSPTAPQAGPSSGPLRVFITGGTQGIGRAIALRFAREGALVAIAARTSGDLDAVAAEIIAAGGQAEACQANLRDHGSLEAAVFRAVDFFDGATDVVVNCAGPIEFTPFDEVDLDAWERYLAVHLTGPYLVLAEALPSLRESDRPHVFNVGAQLAATPGPGCALLATVKAGIAGLGRALRADPSTEGIRVTTVLPNLVDTPGMAPHRDRFAEETFVKAEAVADAIWDAYHADVAPIELAVD